ncbi:MAG: GNAT family N-acetyltransferase [Thermoanaerobaculia bacterium]
MSARIRSAEPRDVPEWLALAKEVEHLFGPMSEVSEFRAALDGAIGSGHALAAVVSSDDGAEELAGGIVFSPEGGSIEWLAVSTRARGAGLGRQLLAAAIARLDPERPIRVQTFAPASPDGAAARRLYAAFGFEDLEDAVPTPAGVPTVIMVRPPLAGPPDPAP